MNPVNCNNIEDNYLLTNFSSIGNLPKSKNDQYESFAKKDNNPTTTKPPTSTPTNPPDQIEQDNSNDTANNTSWWGSTSSGTEGTEGAVGTAKTGSTTSSTTSSTCGTTATGSSTTFFLARVRFFAGSELIFYNYESRCPFRYVFTI
jgi:cytoskeletal protein RodZ